MRVALFSDIHANLPALEACLKNIQEQKPDAIYCLGDLVGYNIWANEVINEIRRRGIPTIAGNYDKGIGLMSDECGCAYKTELEKDMGKISISYTNSIVKPEERKYLRTLPAHIKVEFRQGDIEKMPVTANIADVIVSNCVLNLVPDKDGVMKEIFRTLKPGGHFSISDIVLEGELPTQIKEAAEMYAGCVAGAIQKSVYLNLIEANGFKNITVQKDKAIIIPDDILSNYLSAEQIASFKQSGTGIRSITVYAEKPAEENKACCGPECCN